jgi:hypothetical protein
MAKQYNNNMKGALFYNDNKREDSHDPDRKGSCTIFGVELWVNGWDNTSKSGNRYVSLSFTPKDPKSVPDYTKTHVPSTPKANNNPNRLPVEPVQVDTDDIVDDELPF